MIHTPWKSEFQSLADGYGILDATGRLVASRMDEQAAFAAALAVNKAFPPGSPQCRAPGIIAPDYAKPYAPGPSVPRIA